MHVSQQWTERSQQLSEQYHHLANWIQKTGIIPWHIDIDWTDVSLLIHLHDDIFFQIFENEALLQFEDRQGCTWRRHDSHLNFTCFIPHLQQRKSA